MYPIVPKNPTGIIGYDQFTGGIPKFTEKESMFRDIGRRKQYGSEDRVGHILAKLQKRFTRPNGGSCIQCTPTVKQIKAEKIKHIVFVDDICGSGKRVVDYWKTVVHKSIKSFLSFKRIELWIIFYTMTEGGKKTLEKTIFNFPSKTHLITLSPEYKLSATLDYELIELAKTYSNSIKMKNSGLGYRGSSGLVVFEHGCPNNIPAIFWAYNKYWKGLFPNCSVPTELKHYFDKEEIEQPIESLWNANQKKLALSLLKSIEEKRLSTDEIFLFSIIAFILKGINSSRLAEYLFLSERKFNQILQMAIDYSLCTKEIEVTLLGKDFLKKYRSTYGKNQDQLKVEKTSHTYYPRQCEGVFHFSGKPSEVMDG